MDHAARGAATLSEGDALTAVTAYTEALIQHPSSPDYFIQRSTALTRLKAPHEPQHELSLADAEHAVLLAQKRARREKIQAAQQRRVIALFRLGQFANAAFVLKTMEKWRTSEKKDKMEGDMWRAKIEQKVKDLSDDDPAGRVTVDEYPSRELPTEAAMRKRLEDQLTTDRTFKISTHGEDTITPSTRTDVVSGGESDNAPARGIQVAHETIVESAPAPSSRPASNMSGNVPPAVRHEWFQNSQNVTLTIYAKGVPKDQTDIQIEDDSVSVSFPQPSNSISTFTFNLDPLFAPIDAAASTSSVLSTKLELVLRKKVPGQKWNTLEASSSAKAPPSSLIQGSKSTTADTATPVKPTPDNTKNGAQPYPTSSRSGPKDWDKVVDDLTAKKGKGKGKGKAAAAAPNGQTSGDGNDGVDDDDDGDEDDDADSEYGGDAVDGFFKKLYAGADPDTRRAMMKSYQESGGTALSTDWGDVGKRKVVPAD